MRPHRKTKVLLGWNDLIILKNIIIDADELTAVMIASEQ